jgi:lipopolysaccharide transport system ATP-binding protein
MSEVLIKVEKASKRFCRSLKRSLWYGLQDLGSEIGGRRHGGGFGLPQCSSDVQLRRDEFWAVKDVSFELRRGECLGLIGRNGAGKTTLLRMLNGLIKPDSGQIEMRGSLGALIALGAGFNPSLTGRENIYTNASVLGFSKDQVSARLTEILEFSELEEFIDTPVQSYSSGMIVRLGFSVATCLIQPDILLLDEVLAVGDIGFTIKCLNKMRDIAPRSAICFVTHSMQYVSSFCNRVMVMSGGETIEDSLNISKAVDSYFSLFPQGSVVSGSQEASFIDVRLAYGKKALTPDEDVVIPLGEECILSFTLNTSKPTHLSLQIDLDGLTPIFRSDVKDRDGNELNVNPGTHSLTISLGSMDFNSGTYLVTLMAIDPVTKHMLCRHQGAASFRVTSPFHAWGYIVRPCKAYIESEQESMHLSG